MEKFWWWRQTNTILCNDKFWQKNCRDRLLRNSIKTDKRAYASTLKKIQENKELSFKLYAIEFLTSTTGDILVTLIYHKKLEHKWEIEAKLLEKELNISIIGRSRGQKLVLNKEFIEDTICIKEKDLKFYYQEGGFTQPNSKVNIKMIEWVLDNIDSSENDLCELYCGGEFHHTFKLQI